MRTKGWLIYEAKHAKKNQGFIQWFLDEAKELEMELDFILQSRISFGVQNNELVIVLDGETMAPPDFVIMRNIDPLFNEQLERMNIPCFNSNHVSVICNDKARTHQYLAGKGLPMLDTYFTTTEELLSGNLPIPFPFIIKARTGRGGGDVFMVEGVEQLEAVHTQLSDRSIILQPLAGSPGKDLRVYVLGQTIVGAVLRSNSKSFKANFTLGGQAEAYTLNESERTIVYKIIQQFDFGLVGIDFLFDENGGLLFNEIEDVVGCRTLCLTSDINIVKMYLEFILQKLGYRVEPT
ncbi:ATP-grasp domain-containing protein [Sutcliffiella horikoshii]|uniref:ATP-grasp domain-containing protein n=1 Tax=Sutcliffiella horikoshii TaxID=79883 RepID=A0A5D4T3A6_9BACI|nr:ATP-grasp domain-containing protein [Sutcliffiella horikoshii]TYS68952.1 ATP-grasp domain-containing protein [Sutcliffiella horikoshii]